MKFTIRKIILSFIPRSGVRFFKKKFNLSYLLFGAAKRNVGVYHIDETGIAFTLYGMERQLGEKLSAGFKDCYNEYAAHPGFLRKYLLQVNNCIIEPQYGWAITTADKNLVFDSISNNTWIESYHPDYFKFKKHKKSAKLIEEAASINIIAGGENNYWHFLHDLLAQVIMVRENIGINVPFIISRNLSQRIFFKQALLQSKELAEAVWLFREDWYHVKKAWFAQPMPNSNEQFFKLRDLLHVPDADKLKSRKIFLTRSEKRIRFLKNRKEIETIAEKYGFEIIDTDGLSLQEQIKIFSETRYLVGIHGAGLTNMFYRKNGPMSLFELLPGDYLQPHYFWLAKGMGFEYDFVVGAKAGIDTSFHVPAENFEDKLQSFIK